MSDIILSIINKYHWIDKLNITPTTMTSQGGFINPILLVNMTIKSASFSAILDKRKDFHSFSTNQMPNETFMLLNNIKESEVTELINELLSLKYYFKETVDYNRAAA